MGKIIRGLVDRSVEVRRGKRTRWGGQGGWHELSNERLDDVLRAVSSVDVVESQTLT
jgi:hypothetical protein